MKIIQYIKSRLDWTLYGTTIVSCFAFVGAILATLFFPERFGYESSYIENSQLVILAAAFFICTRAKEDKGFFRFCALIIFIMLLREVNCGRVFFMVDGNIPKDWSQIWKYGFWIRPAFKVLIFGTILYFFVGSPKKTAWKYLKTAKMPVIDTIFMGMGVLFCFVGEYKKWIVFEESFEALFYVALTSVLSIFVFKYSKEKVS